MLIYKTAGNKKKTQKEYEKENNSTISTWAAVAWSGHWCSSEATARAAKPGEEMHKGQSTLDVKDGAKQESKQRKQ